MKKLNIQIFALLFLAVGLFFGGGVGKASATTYYVDNEMGDDSADGLSWSTAFGTMNGEWTADLIPYNDEIYIKATDTPYRGSFGGELVGVQKIKLTSSKE